MPGQIIYSSNPTHPFYASLKIGSDTFTYLDANQGRMLIQDGGIPDRFNFRATGPDLTSTITFDFRDNQGTVFSSLDMPESLDIAQFEQNLDFTFTRIGPQNEVITANGILDPFSFSAAPPPPGVPEPVTVLPMLLAVAALGSRQSSHE